ncbi:unnamed protein product, partial [Mesorhabditis spiculigera]
MKNGHFYMLFHGVWNGGDSVSYVRELSYPGLLYQLLALGIFFIIFLVFGHLFDRDASRALEQLMILTHNDPIARQLQMVPHERTKYVFEKSSR